MTDSILPLAEMRQQLFDLAQKRGKGGGPKYIFRGQRRDYHSVVPTYDRLTDDSLRGAAFTAFRTATQSLRGQLNSDPGERTLDKDQILALLQHYGWPSPMLDFTHDVETAIFFALHKWVPPDIAIVFVLDLDALPAGVRTVNNDILLMDPDYKRDNPRWARQYGWGVMPIDWPGADVKIDLRGVMAGAITVLNYSPTVGDCSNAPPGLLAPDEIGKRFKVVMQGVCEAREFLPNATIQKWIDQLAK